ncbi:hypothetical protein HID58_064986 [Brassica napus]|uniref:Protein FAR1-RELATED SEQUENCE n=1 Tax=Brassica napus TaxID=3708 RepID=A0ABQ7ZBK2_BRANA|nr:hypothetical protein HID58_064986 [Brassica napus]
MRVVELMYYDSDYESESELDSPKLKRQKRALYTPEEEFEVIRDQVLKSEGFDVDFSNIRCEFNFSPVDLLHDGYLINMFCNMAVEEFNKFYGKKVEFVEAHKAVCHFQAGRKFYITFQGREDNQLQLYQAMIQYHSIKLTQVVFCRPKPPKAPYMQPGVISTLVAAAGVL